MSYWVVREGSELEHYGVKGMKWGVRKEKLSSSTSPTSKNQNGSSEKKDSKSKDLIDKGKQLVKENWPLAIIAAVLPGVSFPMLLAGKAAIESYKLMKISSLLH